MSLRLVAAFAAFFAPLLPAAAGGVPTHRTLFEQASPDTFEARAGGYALRFSEHGIDLAQPDAATVRISFEGASVKPVADGPVAAESHYYLGRDPKDWKVGVPNFGRIRYRGIYPGVDLVVYGTEEFFEYDLEVAAHADPSAIRMIVSGDAAITEAGDLDFGVPGFGLRKPVALQNGKTVPVRFRIDQGGGVRFALGKYDPALPLVIDPVITYATYHGGSWGELISSITADAAGNVYVAGYTGSPNFPGNPSYGIPPQVRQFGFVSKFAPMVAGTSELLYTIFLGDNSDLVIADVRGVAVDRDGNVILAGATSAARFPVVNAHQPELFRDVCATETASYQCPDGFVTKFAPNGRTVIFSTYHGANGYDSFSGVAVGPEGDIYAYGIIEGSSTLRGTPTAYQRSGAGSQDGWVARYSPTGELLHSTFFGGAGSDLLQSIAVESPGVVWLAGQTTSTNLPVSTNAYQKDFTAFRLSAFVARLDLNSATGLTYGTYFGASGGNSSARRVLLDSSNQVIFCGTQFAGLPAVTPTALQATGLRSPLPSVVDPFFNIGDGFIARLNPSLNGTSQLTYASHVGGNQAEFGISCGLDKDGNFLVAGSTYSSFPFVTPGSPIPFKGSPTNLANIFAIRIDPNTAGGRMESILFGGLSHDSLVDMFVSTDRKFAYLAGRTFSRQFPVTTQAMQSTYGGDTTTFEGAAVDSAIGSGEGWLAQLDLVKPQKGAVALKAVAGDYQFANPGVTLPVNPKVQLTDSDGNPVLATGYPVAFAGTNVQVVGGTVLTDSDGAAANLVRIVAEGPATLTTSIEGLLTPYTFHFRGISGMLPSSVAILSGSNQSGTAGAPVPQPLVVEIRDAGGAPLLRGGFPVQFKAENVTVSSAVVDTDGQGRASTMVTLGTSPGPMRVRVTVGSLPVVTADFSAGGPLVSAAGVVNAATFQSGPVSAGLIVTMFGQKIGPPTLVLGAPSNGKFPTIVSGVRVLFDGVPAPIVYVSEGQTSAIVPYAVAGKTSTQMVVEVDGVASAPVSVPVAAARPGLFSANSSGAGQGAILNQDNTVNSAANPANRGDIVVLFGTGEGQTNPAGVDGQLADSVYPAPILPVRVRIGGIEAEVVYAGAAPTLVAGVLQVNVRIPAGVAPGNAAVELIVGEVASPAGITVAVQ